MTRRTRAGDVARAVVVFVLAVTAATLPRARAATSSPPTKSSAPGARPWIVERAELHGLSTNALEEASSNVETIVSRDCFLVAKDGAIVHESYYGANDANTQHVVDGVGTLALVVAAGVALQQGLFELDAPLAKYDLRSVEEAFGAYADQVSVRQLLAQTHGGGSREPGGSWERDDPHEGPFLDIIGDIIESRSGMKLGKWARLNVGEKIGAPDMYESSSRADGNEGASLWRDLTMTCRDAAKLGQLFVNQGRWMSADGSTRQMFDPSFAVTALSVSYPQLNQAHGFMTWLHVPVSATGSQCCSPRATKTSCGKSAEAINGPILGKNAPHAPVAVSLGDEGSMIYMLPQTNTVVVTLGRTTAGSPACPAAPSDVVAKAGTGRRDDAYLVRTMWSAMGGALKPMELEKPTKSTQRQAALERDWRRWEEKKSEAKKSSSSSSEKSKSKSRRSHDVADQGLSESSGILDAVREAITQVMGGVKTVDDGLVHDGHATYQVPGDADSASTPATFRTPLPEKPPTQSELAEAEYNKRQVEYAHEMQEREYKKFEEDVQKDYRKALKATREKYQKDMRAAQKSKDATERARREDAAATKYLEAVNDIEDTGKQALQQLDSWRKATLPPLLEDGKKFIANGGGLENVEHTSDEHKRHAKKELERLDMTMQGMSEKMKRISRHQDDDDNDDDDDDNRSDVAISLPKLGVDHTARRMMRGSCVCGCPNTKSTQATCFDIDATALESTEQAAEACASMHSRAGLGCPHTGIVQQCGDVIGKRGLAAKELECRQVRRCPRTKEDAAKTAFLAAVFDCRPTRFATCAFVAKPCARSRVLVKPVAPASNAAFPSKLSRPQSSRRAAHKFHEHDHTHMSTGAQRIMSNASAEASVALAVAFLALALITIATKWPTTVTGGNAFATRMVKTKPTSAPERAPLLQRRPVPSANVVAERLAAAKAETRAQAEAFAAVSATSSASERDEDVQCAQGDVVERFPRPIKIPQPQTRAFDEVSAAAPSVFVEPKTRARSVAVESVSGATDASKQDTEP